MAIHISNTINPQGVEDALTELNTLNLRLDKALSNNTLSSHIKDLRNRREKYIHYLESQGVQY